MTSSSVTAFSCCVHAARARVSPTHAEVGRKRYVRLGLEPRLGHDLDGHELVRLRDYREAHLAVRAATQRGCTRARAHEVSAPTSAKRTQGLHAGNVGDLFDLRDVGHGGLGTSSLRALKKPPRSARPRIRGQSALRPLSVQPTQIKCGVPPTARTLWGRFQVTLGGETDGRNTLPERAARMAAPVLFQHRKQVMWIDVGTDAAYLKFLLQFCDGGRARVFDRDQLTLLSTFC